MKRLARFLRRAWDMEAGAFGQSSPAVKNAALDDIAAFLHHWKLRP